MSKKTDYVICFFQSCTYITFKFREICNFVSFGCLSAASVPFIPPLVAVTSRETHETPNYMSESEEGNWRTLLFTTVCIPFMMEHVYSYLSAMVAV